MIGMGFKVRMDVRLYDLNYRGHVSHATHFLYAQHATDAFFRSLGFSDFDIGGGIGVVMVKEGAEFKSECFLGDTLEIEIGVRVIQEESLLLEFRIFRTNRDPGIVVKGEILLVAYDYTHRKKTRIPAEFREAISKV